MREHLGQRRATVDGARVNREAGSLARKAPLHGREADVVAHQAHQVFGIAAVVNGEVLVQADLRRVFAQQARADAMEGAGPGQGRRRIGFQAEHARQHLPGTALHLLRRAARRSARGCAADRRRARSDGPRDARACWSCPSPRRQSRAAAAGLRSLAEGRADTVLHRRTLLVVELGERGREALGLARGCGCREALHRRDFTGCPSRCRQKSAGGR